MMNLNTLLLCTSLSFIAVGCEEVEPVYKFDEFCDGRELAICDISQASCNQPLSEFVACLRERPLAGIPRFEVISEEAWRAEEIAYLDSEEAQKRDQLVTALELFDRFPSTRPTREERIEAHSKVEMIMREPGLIALVDHGEGFASESHYLGYVQLLTLMMLQQEHDLSETNAPNAADPSHQSAVNAIVLGTQTLYANLVRSALEKTSYWRFNWSSVWAEDRINTYSALLSGEKGLGEYVGRQAPIPRYFGARAVHYAFSGGHTAGVEQLVESPPSSSSPWDTQRIVDTQPALDSGLRNFEQVSDFVMGSWFSFFFVHRLMPPEESPSDSVTTAADRLWVFHDSSSETTAAIWIWAPGGTVDANDWESSIGDYAASYGKPWFVSTRYVDGENVLVLVACDDPTLLPLWETTAIRMLNTLEIRSPDTGATL